MGVSTLIVEGAVMSSRKFAIAVVLLGTTPVPQFSGTLQLPPPGPSQRCSGGATTARIQKLSVLPAVKSIVGFGCTGAAAVVRRIHRVAKLSTNCVFTRV